LIQKHCPEAPQWPSYVHGRTGFNRRVDINVHPTLDPQPANLIIASHKTNLELL
jgi:hypothetical protein